MAHGTKPEPISTKITTEKHTILHQTKPNQKIMWMI